MRAGLILYFFEEGKTSMASDRNIFENMTAALEEIERLNDLLDQKEAERRELLDLLEKAEDLNLRYRRELAEAGRDQEESKRLKSDFLASVSHEIRTPMNAVLGISAILLHNDTLPPQQRKYIIDIKNASESLQAVISDILDLAQIETAKVDLTPVHFNFRVMLGNICSRTQYLARTKGVDFIYKPEGELPMYLFAADVRYWQVIQGLLDNAMTHTRQGSVTFEPAVEEQRLLVTVTDTGSGIKEEEQPFVFDPFRRTDSDLNPGLQGTGPGLSLFRAQLNLALCKKLAVLLGGDIEFQSVFGQGSVFRLTLPLVPGEEAKMQPSGRPVKIGGERSVLALIVDDDEVNLNVTSGLLKNLYDIDSDRATSGRQALDKIRQVNYDLIFMDHMMPEMDGLETTARIRALGGKFKDMPIIALTANNIIGNREKLLSSGFSDFLSKPLNQTELGEVLRKWVPGGREFIASPAVPAEEIPVPNGLLEKVAALDMMDVTVGLKTVVGNRDLYVRSLRILKDKIPGVLHLLEELLKREDLGELAVYFHGLKSSLAAVGGVALTRLAQNLERAAASGDLVYVRDYMPPFVRLLTRLGDGLALIFNEDEGRPPKMKGETSFLKSGLKALHHALEKHDSEAVDHSLKHLLQADFGREVERILQSVRDKIDQFEYETVAEILKTSFEDL